MLDSAYEFDFPLWRYFETLHFDITVPWIYFVFSFQIVQFNAHEVSEFHLLGPKTFDGAKNEALGAAIYPTLALFNHSCHSAQVR